MTARRTTVLEGTRTRRIRNPKDGEIEAAVLNMARETSVVLSETDDTYIQVWQRPDGIYQLEHRAGSPQEHFQTLTVSPEKVHTAFIAWRRNEAAWADPWTWKSISEMF
ncbi:hypothetical protein [Lentzea sp. NPDC051838]|uniref:hypothetical protein n=1 Tax=Lentzea sp. NPDC051838 TaxID=3154849 RepID=UPI0034434C65